MDIGPFGSSRWAGFADSVDADAVLNPAQIFSEATVFEAFLLVVIMALHMCCLYPAQAEV